MIVFEKLPKFRGRVIVCEHSSFTVIKRTGFTDPNKAFDYVRQTKTVRDIGSLHGMFEAAINVAIETEFNTNHLDNVLVKIIPNGSNS